MDETIKVGDKEFIFKLPVMQDKSVTNALNDWCKLLEKQDNVEEDEWSVIPVLPEYRFKNLRMISGPIETTDNAHELTITIQYDNYAEINRNS